MQKQRVAFGFSLVELILVMAILLALTVPIYLRWFGSSMMLTSQTQILANNLRYTQNLSMTQHQRFSLVIISETSYKIQDAAGQAVKNLLDDEVVTLTSGVKFDPFEDMIKEITFSSTGVPFILDRNSLSVPLTTPAELPLTLNGRTTVVTVNPATGMVTP